MDGLQMRIIYQDQERLYPTLKFTYPSIMRSVARVHIAFAGHITAEELPQRRGKLVPRLNWYKAQN
jgi:hypothetical protein